MMWAIAKIILDISISVVPEFHNRSFMFLEDFKESCLGLTAGLSGEKYTCGHKVCSSKVLLALSVLM